jgi:hypothetical protein
MELCVVLPLYLDVSILKTEKSQFSNKVAFMEKKEMHLKFWYGNHFEDQKAIED